MSNTKKVAFFCSNKDPVPVNLQSHVIYQFECPGFKAKYIGKTDRCLEFRLNEHSDFRTSAVGKHLYECENFHHIVNLFTFLFILIRNLLSLRLGITSVQLFQGTLNYRQKQQLALFLGVSLYQTTESRPQCRHQSHQRTKSFQIGRIVLLFIFSALLIVYVCYIIAQHLCIVF